MARDRKSSAARPSQSDLRSLWESGVPLDSAWIELAGWFDHFGWRALHTHPDQDAEISYYPRYQELKDWLPKTWEKRQAMQDEVRDVKRVHLLKQIYVGHLWAIGSYTLPDGFDELRRVPRQLFFVDEKSNPLSEFDIDWIKGELKTRADSYFDIRVMKAPDSIDQSEHTGRDEATENKPTALMGRPSTKQQIREAVEFLLRTDPDFSELPNRQTQAMEVRVHLLGEARRQAHDAVGYNTNTIVKIIGQVVKASKKKQEQTDQTD